MRVLKFAWHLFWAARRCPREDLAELIQIAAHTHSRKQRWDFICIDTELTEALRRYGR